VPDAPTAADTGCVDTDGTLHATAGAWYPNDAQGTLVLGGDPLSTAEGDDFVGTAQQAVNEELDGFTLHDSSEAAAAGQACATHRFVVMERADGSDVAVSVWRAEHAAAPSWVANENGFAVKDASTLVADGESIRVALAVAPDGTTVRVTAYGPNARSQVSGWPTTIVVPNAPPPGPAPASLAQVVDISQTVLSDVMNSRR
jgi:hypothetical protein